MGMNIGFGAITAGIAIEDAGAHRVCVDRDIHIIAFGFQPRKRCVERFEHREELRRTGCAAAGREVEQHDADAAFGFGGAAQCHQLFQPRSERLGAFRAALHRADGAANRPGAAARTAGAGGIAAIRTPAEHHRRGAAIKLRDGDHDRRFERQQPLPVGAPRLQCLEFNGMRRDIRTIDRGQRGFGGLGIIISGPADKAEPGQVDDRIDGRHAILHEKFVEHRPGIETTGKGRNDVEPAGFERADDAVIVIGILAEHIGA